MARMISRRDAAQMLQVEGQTISNWVEKGLLTGHLIDGRLFVDKNTITRYFDTLQQLGQTEERINTTLADVRRREEALDRRLENIATAEELAPGMPEWFRENVFCAVLAVAGNDVLCERERSILELLINGRSMRDIHEEYGITRERVCQVVRKAFRKIYTMRTFSDIRQENKRLLRENKELKNVIKLLGSSTKDTQLEGEPLSEEMQKAAGRWYIGDGEITTIHSLLSASMSDFNLSVRALNCLKTAEVETLADLLRYDESELLKYRNFGRKSLKELVSFVEDFGLSFGMDVDAQIRKSVSITNVKE